jgi:hypothetical protein
MVATHDPIIDKLEKNVQVVPLLGYKEIERQKFMEKQKKTRKP